MFTALGELPKPILGGQISPVFLETIGCPLDASDLVFKLSAAGTLQCVAKVWEGSPPVQVEREWEVQLRTTDAFYKVLTGVIR